MRVPLINTDIDAYISNNYHYGYTYTFRIAFKAIYCLIGYSQIGNSIVHIETGD